MKIYKDKDELKTEILGSFEKYIGEFKDVCEDDKDELRGTDEATKTAVWEVYKFIRVNTVAPFRTFRAKIRAWKKAANLKELKNGIVK